MCVIPLLLFGLGAVIDQNFELWSFNFVEALRSFTLWETQQDLFVYIHRRERSSQTTPQYLDIIQEHVLKCYTLTTFL